MKKYFYSFLALALAIGFTSFTLVKKSSDVTVVYDGANPLIPGNVENPSNWDVQVSPPTCDDEFDELPCIMVLDESFTESGTLKSDVVITVLLGDLSYYVPISLKEQDNTPIAVDITNKVE